MYYVYLEVELGNQGKIWTPRKSFALFAWKNSENVLKKNDYLFGVPLVLREPQNYNNCYFCSYNVEGFDSKNKEENVYLIISFAISSVNRGPCIPVPSNPEKIDDEHKYFETGFYNNNDNESHDATGSSEFQFFHRAEWFSQQFGSS